MRISMVWLRRQIAGGLVMLLAFPLTEAAGASPRQAPGGQQQSVFSAQNQPKDSDSRAGTPGADTSQAEATYPDNPAPARSQPADQSAPSGASQSPSDQQQNTAPKPVGTAAAPYEKTTGVAASRPAGAVIAPAKQRRARAILIRVGVIVGAAVAVGTVVALSKGSPSRPN
jgi:hypothetical protein